MLSVRVYEGQHKTDFDLQPSDDYSIGMSGERFVKFQQLKNPDNEIWEILAYTYRDAGSEPNGRVIITKDFPTAIFIPYEGIEIQARFTLVPLEATK